MKKEAITVDPATVARYALGGLAIGGSGAALLNLIRTIRDMKQEHAQATATPETSEDTIVLTLPKKASILEDIGTPAGEPEPKHTLNPHEEPKEVSKPLEREPTRKNQLGDQKLPPRPGTVQASTKTLKRESMIEGKHRQARHHDGSWGIRTMPKTADGATGWPTLTAGVLAALTGGTLGAQLVNTIYTKRRERKLEQQLNSARKEYLDMIMSKGGSGDLFKEAMDKEAISGFVNYPLAMGALLTLLGSGGVAYITKKIMDEKLRSATEMGMDAPKAKRIVFRTATDPEDKAEEKKVKKAEDSEAAECARAALGIMLDHVSGTTAIMDTPYVKEALEKSAIRPGGVTSATPDIDNLLSILQSSPALRRAIQRATMERHPMLRHFKWSLGVPGIGALADRSLYSKVRSNLAPPINNLKTAMNKNAVMPITNFGREIITSMVGSELAGQNQAESIAKEILKQQALQSQAGRQAPAKVRDEKIELAASDPKAKAYLEKNKIKVMKVIQKMIDEGKL